jgi:hypothetical protein
LSSEDELIRRAQAGETDAFCLLAQAYERRIYSLAFHYCRDRQDAEDLSQEVWLKVYAALATFRNESTFYIVTRFEAGDTLIHYGQRRSNFLSFDPTTGVPTLVPFTIRAETRHNFQFVAGVGWRF